MPEASSSSTTGSPPKPLVAAISRILRPLVGLLLEHGLTYTWLTNHLKSIYVDLAQREFRLPGKKLTDSRITLLTGVHRKDVRRLRLAPSEDSKPPESVFLGAQLVARWTSDDRFLNKRRQPRPLARLPIGEGEASFEDLVTSVSKDIRPRSVLDEWLRLGVVEFDRHDRVILKTSAFIPAKGFEEKAYYLGQNLHDHLAAARHNVQNRQPALLERAVYYDELTPESVAELRQESEKEAMRALKAINAIARKLQQRDRHADNNHHRMNFGTYFYQADELQESGSEDDQD